MSSAGQQVAEIARGNADEHLIKRIDPEYPPLAKAARLQGKVLLKVTISKDGAVTSVSVVSGHPMLIPSALTAVSKRLYEPTVLDGVPTPIDLRVEINFSFS